VEQVACVGIEAAHATLAEDDLRVALQQDILGGEQPLLDGRREATLEQNRALRPANSAQQREVLHVATADLQDIGVLGDGGDQPRLHYLGDDRQASLASSLRQCPQARQAEPLEAVG